MRVEILLHLVCGMLGIWGERQLKRNTLTWRLGIDAGDGIPLLALGKDKEGATVAT